MCQEVSKRSKYRKIGKNRYCIDTACSRDAEEEDSGTEEWADAHEWAIGAGSLVVYAYLTTFSLTSEPSSLEPSAPQGHKGWVFLVYV